MSRLIIDNHIIREDIKTILSIVQRQASPGKLKRIIYDGDNIRVTCPVHKDGQENKPSCSLYVGSSDDVTWGTVHCFACGFKGQLFDFIAEACDKPVYWAKRFLKDNFTESIIDDETFNIDEPISFKKAAEPKKPIDQHILDNYQSWHPYMQQRKLSKEVCERFDVKYDPASECIVFPVRSLNGNISFCTRRSINSKKFIIDKDIDKDVYLLYDVIKDNVREVYVVESQINALTLWSWGYPAIALLGTGTDHQYDLLNKSGILSYKLCFDGDEAGRNGIKKFIKNVSSCFISVIKIPEGKDVNDLSKNQFDNLEIKEI